MLTRNVLYIKVVILSTEKRKIFMAVRGVGILDFYGLLVYN